MLDYWCLQSKLQVGCYKNQLSTNLNTYSYLEPCLTCKMEGFAKTVNSLSPLLVFRTYLRSLISFYIRFLMPWHEHIFNKPSKAEILYASGILCI